MQLNIIAIGKIKEKYLEPGIVDFQKRLQRFVDVKISEIPALADNVDKDKALQKEADLLLAKSKAKAYKVALTPQGKLMSSEGLAEVLPKWFELGQAEVEIYIGSSRGLHRSILDYADTTWSFGLLTLTHGVARYIALEQLYRAFKINVHESYHK